MSSKVITFDVDFINQFRHKMNRTLPEKVMRTLNMSTKIKSVMNEKDLKIFNRKLDNFDETVLKKKLHSLLNKLAKQNIDSIFQKVTEILKNRKVLIEYAIKMLITNVVSMPFLADTYAQFYKKLYTPKTEEIFQETFKGLMDVLGGAEKSVTDKDYDKFCKYMQDKKSFCGLFIFMANLYKQKIIRKSQINLNLKYLETTILKSTPDQNEKFADAYVKFIKQLNKKEFIDLKKIAEIKRANVLSTRLKFGMLGLTDLQKKM